MNYTRQPAMYAKNMVAIRCPSTDHFKSLAAIILEHVAAGAIRYTHRERAYIVSKRTADRFEAEVLRRKAAQDE